MHDFRPQFKHETKTTLIDKPRFPVIDAYNHLSNEFGRGWIERNFLENFKKALDYVTKTISSDL